MSLINWTSGNEKIDVLIQEMHLNIEDCNDVFEWIPYNQLTEIKETSKNNSITIYLAIWKNGPLYYNEHDEKYIRESNKEVALKYLQNSQNDIKYLINEV
jgi:hypothetical protein